MMTAIDIMQIVSVGNQIIYNIFIFYCGSYTIYALFPIVKMIRERNAGYRWLTFIAIILGVSIYCGELQVDKLIIYCTGATFDLIFPLSSVHHMVSRSWNKYIQYLMPNNEELLELMDHPLLIDNPLIEGH